VQGTGKRFVDLLCIWRPRGHVRACFRQVGWVDDELDHLCIRGTGTIVGSKKAILGTADTGIFASEMGGGKRLTGTIGNKQFARAVRGNPLMR